MNRAFLYGDGFFETIKIVTGKPAFWNLHWERILRSLSYLSLDLALSRSVFETEVERYITLNSIKNARLRITFYRMGEGAYFPTSNNALFEFSHHELSEVEFQLRNPFRVSLSSVSLPKHEQGNHKLIQKTQQIRAALEARNADESEAILLNDAGELSEAIASNLFLIKKDAIVTPPLSSGCLDGTLRKHLVLHYNGVKERSLTLSDAVQADALFLTNSIKGIQPVFLKQASLYDFQPMVNWLNETMFNSIADFQEIQP